MRELSPTHLHCTLSQPPVELADSPAAAERPYSFRFAADKFKAPQSLRKTQGESFRAGRASTGVYIRVAAVVGGGGLPGFWLVFGYAWVWP